ncbi:MAG TPA: bifunctional diaminohydroxyphosphoribosylaminopyrimidine deaminase/5-amino-6-(5-phosphoribosylamino)uracil reductase RibD [Beijerinckia sp.]|jgi:diaminohydroxyphosphoribosylaminopyrimidine deaminase/5-amino-6-(5-phosphoribosylamino)uracil reductase|nr:bifunctional diaminohydroxyphosphoribosylaminopyrimidine deaminase/5-amino-6-(5-phosphoribosylamino)uracil reductase RibD [Beijerinckia sp.]
MNLAMPPLAIDAETDARFMAAALALGRRGLGVCAPNPAVGALIVKDGVVLGRGWTKPGGRPHAETEALRDAGDARGATLYVTLEPCSHHGVTPPCAEAIIKAGIARVVSALDDPDPRVSGRGHKMLLDAGVEVTTGVLAGEAHAANLGHILRVQIKRPMVTLKLAMTADGYVAGAEYDPRLAITGLAANGLVHVMRSMHDAIMVGSGTIAADDPLLTVRLPGLEARKPWRVVLDSNLRLPLHARLARAARAVPTLVIAAEAASETAAARLREVHIEVEHVRRDSANHLDLASALQLLAAKGITRVFTEGGPGIADALIGQGLADEIILFTALKPLGYEGVPGLTPSAKAILADPNHYRYVEARPVGADRLTRYTAVSQEQAVQLR